MSQRFRQTADMDNSHPRLEAHRVENDTATRLSYRLDVSNAAVTVFASSDAKTVADQLRALADRIDPQSITAEPATRKRSSRRRMRLLP